VEEDFELERYGSPPPIQEASSAEPAGAVGAGAAAAVEELDFETSAPAPVAPPPIEVAAAPEAPPPPESAIASATLAELYFQQGFVERAAEVYRELLKREPGNARAQIRLRELEAAAAAAPRTGTALAPPVEMTPEPPLPRPPDRREALTRTIERLEGLLAALSRRQGP
jgi:hypothetical protein